MRDVLRITSYVLRRMKNICFFNSHKVWGGGEKWHYDMALRLRQAGYSVRVLTNRPSELAHRIEQENIPLHQIRISNLSFLNVLKILHIRNLLKRYHIQTIFLNAATDVKVAGIAAKLAGVEKIIYRRGIALPVKNTFLNRWLFLNIITDVIAISEETRRTILQNNPALISSEKIKIIYNGIDLQAYDREQTIKIYSGEPGEILLGSAGRLSQEKGSTYLIELARELKNRGMRFKLLIAGKGKLEAQLKHYARTLDVEPEVQFWGFVENIKSFLQNLDIFLLPSLYEGGARVLMEAMAVQKPVVAFNVSSNPEIVVHKETGLLAEKGNITDLANCVEELSSNENQRCVLGKNARRRIEERFDLQKAIKEVITLVEK